MAYKEDTRLTTAPHLSTSHHKTNPIPFEKGSQISAVTRTVERLVVMLFQHAHHH
jgi:hypothetical protein